MKPPRISALLDCENRMRRDWQVFADCWQGTTDSWRDDRRRRFEEDHLRELPAALSRAQAELTQFGDALQSAMRALEDTEGEQ